MSDVVNLLERLIRVDSHNGGGGPGGDERALARVVAEAIEGHQPDELRVVEVMRAGAVGAYVFARWGTPRLLVNAHLDTVPPNAGWRGDPFQPRREEDRVIGLGACDTKGAIAAALAALAETRPVDVGLLFSGDEEHTGSCVRAFLADPAARKIERAIACEPTGCRVGTRHRGILALEARRAGVGGHSSRADELPAPIAELSRLAVAWADWGVRQRNVGPFDFRGMCLNVARLDGGIAFNVIPQEARLTVSLRPPPGSDVGAVKGELFELAAETAPDAVVSAPVENAPFHTRDLHAFAPWLGELARAPVDLGFWTEAALFAGAGIDAVVFGPGSIAQAHAPDEFVTVGDLEKARALFARAYAGGHGAG
jgi:acetylornithine deacetylase